jgi:hypothetical protein
MRAALIPLLLLGIADVTHLDGDVTSVTPLKGLTTYERGGVTQRNAEAILKDMRQALGGEAALDRVKSFSLETTGWVSVQGRSVPIRDHYYFVLPDRYLRVRELRGASLRVFEGFKGDELIRRASHDGKRPGALAEGDRLTLARWRHDAARFVFALLGTSLPTYPLAFSVIGQDQAAGIVYDVVEATADGARMRLYVDSLTHLPVMVTTGGLERAPEIRWLLSKFKRTGPLNWPTQMEEQAEGLMSEEVTVRRWKINPATDAGTFDPR